MSTENLDEILADVKQEGADPFANMEETPSESLPEKEEETPVVEEEEKDENVPFHKHPRWIERENELNELRESNEATARELAELKAMKESKSSTSSEIPAWFSELYGDNETAWQKYSEHEQARTEEIENRILTRQQEEAQKAAQETDKWNKWVDTEVERLSVDHTFDRNKLIKIMLDYSPTDGDNNLDFDKGYAIYEALEGKPDTAKSDARKVLADTAASTSTKGEPAKKDYMTSNELRKRSMASL